MVDMAANSQIWLRMLKINVGRGTQRHRTTNMVVYVNYNI
jgi:hypothetical protein